MTSERTTKGDAMNGTEKQITWANEIKAQVITDLDDIVNGDKRDEVITMIDKQTDAAWWITNKVDVGLSSRDIIIKILQTETGRTK